MEQQCELVFDVNEANYCIIVSDVETKKTIGILYFKLAFGASTVHMIHYLENYPEYIKPNYRIDICKVKDGRRYVNVR